MSVLYFLVGLFACIIGYPYVRYLLLRMACARQIGKACRSAGHRLHSAHRLWFLSGRRTPRCDLYIETAKEILAVKLFGVPRRASVLILSERGDWRIRRFAVHVAGSTSVCLPWEGKARPLPRYDFTHGYRGEWQDRPMRPLLLVHPAAMELHYLPARGDERIVSAGDRLHGMELATLPHLLHILKA